MNEAEMLEKIREIICQYVEIEPTDITPETNVRSELGMNSLELVNLAVAIEDAFGTEIPDREVSGLETIGDAIRIIREYAE